MIDEQMIQTPATRSPVLVANRHLPREQHPMSRRLSQLLSGEQPRMVSQQRLEDILGLERTLGQCDEFAVTLEVDPTRPATAGVIGPHRHVSLHCRYATR